MSESLSEDELADLIHNGRINTPRSAAKRREAKTSISSMKKDNNKPKDKTQSGVPRPMDSSPQEVSELPIPSSEKELDPEWLRVEKEKAERNIVTQTQDKRRREEMQEASKF